MEGLRQKALGPRGSKREKLKVVLKKKLGDKYGKKWIDVISDEVDRFITSTMTRKITEDDLAALENKVRTKCRLTETQRSSARQTGRSVRPSARASARQSARQSARNTGRKPTGRGSVPQTPKNDAGSELGADEWTLLDAFDAMMNEKKVSDDKRRYREEQRQLKEELDRQVAFKQEEAAAKRRRKTTT